MIISFCLVLARSTGVTDGRWCNKRADRIRLQLTAISRKNFQFKPSVKDYQMICRKLNTKFVSNQDITTLSILCYSAFSDENMLSSSFFYQVGEPTDIVILVLKRPS